MGMPNPENYAKEYEDLDYQTNNNLTDRSSCRLCLCKSCGAICQSKKDCIDNECEKVEPKKECSEFIK